jgi:flagellar basal-body rod protein FlgB
MELAPTAQRVMEAALEVRSARAELLAGNIANADTPGFTARDIKFDDAMSRVLENDNSSDAAGLPSKDILAPENLRFDGNNIDVDQQVATAYQNSLNYVGTLRLYGDSVNRLRSATSST